MYKNKDSYLKLLHDRPVLYCLFTQIHNKHIYNVFIQQKSINVTYTFLLSPSFPSPKKN